MDDLFALAIATLALLVVFLGGVAVGHAYGEAAAADRATERRIRQYGGRPPACGSDTRP